MEQSLRALMQAANDAMVSRGIKMRFFEQDGVMVGQMYVPTYHGPQILESRVVLPHDVVGGKLGKKIKAKAKSIAKKVAKSKLLKAVAKTALSLAVPGGATVLMGAKAIQLAKKLKNAAKHGTPKQKILAKAIAQKATATLRKAQSAPPVAPGYPDAYASALPGESQPGNGLPDADDESIEQDRDPDMGDPDGEVEQDSDEEIGPSDDDYAADEPE